MEKPLMWTAKGNVPVDELTYSHRWEYDGQNLALKEEWHFADGELARNNTHVLAAPGLPIEINVNTSKDVTVGLVGMEMGCEQARMQ